MVPRRRGGPGLRSWRDLGAQASEPAALAGLDAMSHWDGRGALGRLTMPTLVLWGDGDRSYRWPQVEVLWQGLPDAALAVIPGTAHAVHLEKPALFHAMLDDFLTAATGAHRHTGPCLGQTRTKSDADRF